MSRTASILCAVVATAAFARSAAAGCAGPISVWNMSIGSPQAGGFDLAGTSYAGKASPMPDLRFWAFGHFNEANSGTQEQTRGEQWSWLANAAVSGHIQGASTSLFSVWQANWAGSGIVGCPLEIKDSKDDRTVVEVTFADPAKEGSTSHQGLYGVASVPFDDKFSSYNLDDVHGGEGAKGNVIPVKPIPAPRVMAEPKASSAGNVVVNVELPSAISYSEGGKDTPMKLIGGYRILYTQGDEPTSSDPAKYKPAHDPADAAKDAPVIRTGQGAVSVPAGKTWLVAQLVFNDPSLVVSRATSSHVSLAPGAAHKPEASGGGRERSEGSGRHKR